MWQSMAGARGVPWGTLAVTGVAVAVVAALIVSVLPAPKVSTSLIFPSSSANSAPVDSPSNLTDGSASLPAHAANPGGRTGVGGFLGFAKSLDTGARATLGNQVVLRVRASRPSFWVGQTYDYWNGQSWVQAQDPANGGHLARLDFGSPFEIPLQPSQQAPLAAGTPDVQTFYLAQSGPNLVFHADNAQRVYIQSRSLFLTGDGTIVSASSMGAGTVYTVVSDDITATPEQLRQATLPQPAARCPGRPPVDAPDPARYLQLPHAYPRVAALARQITTGIGAPGDPDPHTYDKVSAIESWMSTHVRYTTDIPPLAPGADAVTSFLFGSRRGYCEQISTATVVMLRSLGIPARETVGYVPGSYNPITDLYDVQAKDAHAWVQVWFPGYGWQNFDPTAVVPLANPSPGLGAGPQHDPLPRPPPLDPHRPGRGPGGRRVVVRPPAPDAPADLGPPGGRRPRAGWGPTGPTASHRRDPLGLQRTAGRGRSRVPGPGWPWPPTWWSGPPTAASSRPPTRSPRRWPPPGASPPPVEQDGPGRRGRKGGSAGTGDGPDQDRDTARASSNEAPAASSGR